MSVNRKWELICPKGHGTYGADSPDEECPACADNVPLNTDSQIIDTLGGLEAVRAAADTGISDDQYELLFPLFQTEMPYGTQKARTGDPIDWVQARIDDLASRLIPKEEDLK